MKVDVITAEERKAAVNWLSSRTGYPFPGDFFPEHGICVRINGRLAAVAMLYLAEDTFVAVCGFCIANPENTPRESYDAVNMLLKTMPGYAASFGRKYLLTTFGNRSINHLLERHGFSAGENAETKFKIL